MEHTIIDYTKKAKKIDLVTSSPDYRVKTLGIQTTTFNIHLTLKAFHAEINKQVNDKLCNEVTITFTDKWLIPYNTKYIQLKVKDFLDRWSKVSNYLMVQDYSQVGRLHYHGILEMKQQDKFDRLIINLRKTFGRVECKQISFWDSYLAYMTGLYNPQHEKYSPAIEWNNQRYITNIVLNPL